MADESPRKVFEGAVYRSLEAAAADFRALQAKVHDLEVDLAHDRGVREAAAAAAAAASEPERLRQVEIKVTRLDVRSGIIGAIGGAGGGFLLEILGKFLFAHLGAA